MFRDSLLQVPVASDKHYRRTVALKALLVSFPLGHLAVLCWKRMIVQMDLCSDAADLFLGPYNPRCYRKTGRCTHVIMEGLGLARVLTRLSPVRCCTVKIPKDTI